MPEVILNYFSSTEKPLRYALPSNSTPYSTISISREPQTPIKMGFDIPSSSTEEHLIGNHLREAIDIVRDWAKTK